MNRPPRLLFLLITLIAVAYLFKFDFWNKDLIIRSDGFAYYTYIQGTLVHHDPLNAFHGELEGEEVNRSWMQEGLPGRYLPKMTMGVAYAWVPGYFVADLAASAFDFPRDGWSLPYQLAVGFTGIAFLIIGLWFTWQFIARHFSATAASLTVVVLFLGTNLLQYGSVDNSMSHVYTFGLVAMFLWQADGWLREGRSRQLYLAAFLLGWIVLIRPTNAVVALYVPLMLYQRVSLRKLLTYRTVLAGVIALIPIFPQLVFWKLASGEWVHYSYQKETFYWLKPHIIDGLFSYRNGWLLYTPLMFLSIVGLLPLRKVSRGLSITIGIVLVLHVYVVFCWWCWYYGGSYSIRPMIDIYPLLALPVAASIAWLLRRKVLVWIPSFGLIAVLIWNNLLQIDYLNLGVVTDSTMTKQAFWATFMQPEQPKHLQLVGAYRDPDTDRLRLGLPERQAFDTTVVKSFDPYRLETKLDEKHQFSPFLNLPAAELPDGRAVLIQCTFEVKASDPEANMCFGVISFDEGDLNHGYYAADLQYAGSKEGEWSNCHLYVRKPSGLPANTTMNVYGWFRGDGFAELSSIRVNAITVEYSVPLLTDNPGS